MSAYNAVADLTGIPSSGYAHDRLEGTGPSVTLHSCTYPLLTQSRTTEQYRVAADRIIRPFGSSLGKGPTLPCKCLG